MFKKILFASSATDACDHAARVAFILARQYDAELTIQHILGTPTRGYSQSAVDVKTGEYVTADEDYKSWVKEEIKVYYAGQMADMKKVRIALSVGYPHREILRKARKDNPDLIVMGATPDGPDDSLHKSILAGSTIHRVAKASPVPVMIIARPAASFWGGFSNVVFCTDFSKPSDVAFDYAFKMVEKINGEFHLFHPVDISDVQSSSMTDQDAIERKIREARRRLRSRYVRQMGAFSQYTINAWEGIPYVEVVKYARERHADLIVMAHRTRPEGKDDVRMASHLEQVIVRANCPVISICRKPRAKKPGTKKRG